MLTALVALLAGWAGPMVDGHVHRAARSGVIAHAGPYHLEMVVADTKIQIWLLDQKEQPVRPPRDASILVKTDRPTAERPGPKVPLEMELRPVGDRFEGPLDIHRVLPSGFTARVELRIGGRVIPSQLVWTPLDAKHRLDDRRQGKLRGLDDRRQRR